jgi:radical SAM superfamily enzyme YgiQ (UPF0313 family)
MKFNIILGDLVHNRHIYNYAVPLNIAYVAERTKQVVGESVSMRLFKFPDELIASLQEKPAVLALSNYDWNVNLNRTVISLAREINPDIFVVMGGPNIRKSSEGIQQFLASRTDVDAYVIEEGEAGFPRLVEYLVGIEEGSLRQKLHRDEARIENVAYLAEDGRTLIQGECSEISRTEPIPYPSPWLSGALDRYLLEPPSFPLLPMIESNRGCPYHCAYCTNCRRGSFAGRKMRKFPMEIVLEELRYIFRKSRYDFHLIVADGNFGIFDRDLEIAIEIRRLAEKHTKARGVEICSDKNSLDRNLSIYEILHDLCVPDFAMQTFNEKVLANIGRRNVKLDALEQFVQTINQKSLRVYTDLLVGLPGETKDSHLASVKKAFDVGFHKVNVGDIRLLPGSRMEEDDYQEQYHLKTRFRVIPSAYGTYGGRRVVEYERCIRETDTMSEEDFLSLRLFHGYNFVLYSLEFGRPLLDFARKKGGHPVDVISRMTERPPQDQYPLLVQLVDAYIEHAMAEWYRSVEEADSYYCSDEVFPEIARDGVPKLNYHLGASLLLDRAVRNEFLRWAAVKVKQTISPQFHSAVDQLALFSCDRVYTFPLHGPQPGVAVAEEVREHVVPYLPVGATFRCTGDSFIAVDLDVNEQDRKALIDSVDRYGGSSNLSLAVQVIFQINSRSFLRADRTISPQTGLW